MRPSTYRFAALFHDAPAACSGVVMTHCAGQALALTYGMIMRPKARIAAHQQLIVSPPTGQILEVLGISAAAARIVTYFVLRPMAQPHTRQLQRVLGLGGASLQRELARLAAAGALRRVSDGRLVRYAMSRTSPLWTAFRLIIGAVTDPTGLIHDALLDVSGLHAAFVFGSTARGTQQDDSDVDVFVVEDAAVDRRTLLRQLAEVGALIGREINSVRYTLQSIAERLGNSVHPGSRFVHEVFAGEKRWVAGDAERLLPLATAAGVQMRDALPAAAA